MVKIQAGLDEEENEILESFTFANGCKNKEEALKRLIKKCKDFQDVKDCMKIRNKNKVTNKK